MQRSAGHSVVRNTDQRDLAVFYQNFPEMFEARREIYRYIIQCAR
jgi:hypothetical protein